ncbi:MAG: hypothetical protein IJ891_03035 [Prevotella sp.]|nr:hypothetical protein [Prevotella sp.]
MKTQDAAVTLLLEKIEEQLGRKMMTPKDFDFLAMQVFEKTRQSISVSTLKRVWGYVSSKGAASETTLDLLSNFAGYASFFQFCQQTIETPATEESLPSGRFGESSLWMLGGGFLIAIALFLLILFKPHGTSDRPVLKCGQTFASYEEFLSLFNIKASELLYFQSVPECSVAYVWAPQYNHPAYHNEGNPDSLMPTIAEYLSLKPLDDSPESRKLLLEENRKCYLTAIRNNQVRLVFMKNLPGDTCFTFTGVYRVSQVLSDTTKVVWVRVLSECNLNDLENLARFRN